MAETAFLKENIIIEGKKLFHSAVWRQKVKKKYFIENKNFYILKIKIHESKIAEARKLCENTRRKLIGGFYFVCKTVKPAAYQLKIISLATVKLLSLTKIYFMCEQIIVKLINWLIWKVQSIKTRLSDELIKQKIVEVTTNK